MDKLVLDPEEMESASVYKILAGTVVPRPIGLLSTIDRDGIRNLAPFSFFNAISHTPPLVCVSIAKLIPGGRRKDTLANIMATGEFVANIVSEDLAQAQDICAGEYDAAVDEFELSGLTPLPSIVVRPPRVKESPVNFECRVIHTLPLPQSDYTLVIGRIHRMHLRQDILAAGGRIDHRRLAPVGRLAGNAYCHTADAFTLAHDSFFHVAAPPKDASG